MHDDPHAESTVHVNADKTIEYAYEYLARGWYVFPVNIHYKSDGKKLLKPIRSWKENSSNEKQQIKAWWKSKTWREATIAIDTGKSGLLVIDIDVKNGINGFDYWNEITEVDPESYRTYSVITPTGGQHYYYKVRAGYGDDISIGGSVIGQGIDHRGTGGFVFAPPTLTRDGTYRTKNSDDNGSGSAGVDGVALLPEPLIVRFQVAAQNRNLPVHSNTNECGVEAFAPSTDNLRVWSWEQMTQYLTPYVQLMEGARKGERNTTLYKLAFETSHFMPVFLTRQQIHAVCEKACDTAGYEDWEEMRNTIESAIAVEKQWYAIADQWADGQNSDKAEQLRTERENAFWESRPVLSHIRRFAYGRMAAPWAVLGAVLTRACAALDPRIVLPPIIGTRVSLNLFIGLTGPSGAGKDTAAGTAEDCLTFVNGIAFEELGIGSGEGIAHQFVKRARGEDGESVIEQYNKSVVFTASEISTIKGLAERNSSTLLAELKKAWMGQRLGFAYVDPIKRLPMEKNTYRLNMVAGIQPEHAAVLLDDETGGTPQRWCWIWAADRNIGTGNWEDWAGIEPMKVRLPDLPIALGIDGTIDKTSLTDIGIPEEIRQQIIAEHIRRQRGQGTVSIDQHSTLMQEKIAAVLCCMDGRLMMNVEDWDLAGYITAHSKAVVRKVKATLGGVQEKRVEARTQRDVQREVQKHDAVEERILSKTKLSIVRVLEKGVPGEWTSKKDILTNISTKQREHLEEAILELLDKDIIEEFVQDHPKNKDIKAYSYKLKGDQ